MNDCMNDTVKKYEYVLEPSEIREFCLAALWERFKCRKGVWIRLLVIIVIELFIIPEAAVLVAVMVVVMLIVSGIYNYTAAARMLEGQPWGIWVEGDKLKAERGDCSEVSCRNIQFIRITKHLLMLGYLQSVKTPAWFVVPLHVFENVQERERFLDKIRNPQAASEAGGLPEEGIEAVTRDTAGQNLRNTETREYMRFAYRLDGERWVRFQKGAADILNGTSLGKPMRFYGMVIWGCVMMAVMTSCVYFTAGTLNWLLVCVCFFITMWMVLRLYCRNPEKGIRKQLRAPEVAGRACGVWQVSLTEEAIAVSMPMDMKVSYVWESLRWLLETEEVFYIFHKDKRHFIMIAKESFVSWEQVDIFHRICADKGVQKTVQKKALYVPEWLTWVLFGLIMLVSLGVFTAKIFRDTREMPDDALWEKTGGYREEIVFDYPDYVPLDEQAEVLASLGLQVPEDTIESIRESMAEYDLYDMVEGSPYTWILMDLGAPEYDEDWNLTGYSGQVFWFDFEGFDISEDYIDVLNGMLALAKESPLEGVSDIRENTDGMDWERGRGTITVSLSWQGQVYLYDMDVYYDWIDEKVLGILNSLPGQQESQRRFYATGDNGQGAIVFFCTPEWAKEFMEKTGLTLEMPTAKADAVQKGSSNKKSAD